MKPYSHKPLFLLTLFTCLATNMLAQEPFPAQVTIFFPYGTHGQQSIHYTFNFSLNLLYGQIRKLNGLEISGLTGYIYSDVNGAQIAGIANVADDVRGMQAAGLVNSSSGYVKGMQLTGFLNDADGVNGVQIAGFANSLVRWRRARKGVNGVQIAGFGNISDGVRGIQFAGFINAAASGVGGVQLAGFSNIGEDMKGIQLAGFGNVAFSETGGVQLAGFVNVAEDMSGIQAGGFGNRATRMNGLQISGAYNRSQTLNGLQIGIISVNDTIGRGISLSLINIVKRGFYREWEFSFSDYANITAGYKMGMQRFYTIYTVGANFVEDHLWSAGIGFGNCTRIGNRFNFRPELIAYQYFPMNFRRVQFTSAAHLKFGFVYNLSKKLGLSLAPDVYVMKMTRKPNSEYYKITPIGALYTHEKNNKRTTLGVGFSLGFSIL